jgi:hypothetical protein
MPADPEAVVSAEQRIDHALAKARGQRVRQTTNILISALSGHGLLRDEQAARVVVNATLADYIYGLQSVDIDPRP